MTQQNKDTVRRDFEEIWRDVSWDPSWQVVSGGGPWMIQYARDETCPYDNRGARRID